MPQPSFRLLESAVLVLGASALGLAVIVYFLMEIRYRREIRRNARRLILSSRLLPPLEGASLRTWWLASGRVDRDIIEEILADLCRSGGTQTGGGVEAAIIESGIFERWLRDLRKGGFSRRVRAATSLGYVHDVRGVYALTRAAEDRSPEVRLAVTLSLGRLKDSRGLPGLIRLASTPSSPTPDFTLAAALAACAKDSPGRLASLLQARGTRTRMIGAWALSEVADKTVLRYLLTAAQDPEAEVRAKAARALARIPGDQCTDALLHLARDPVWFVRVRALDALGKLQVPAGEPAALLGLQDEVREVRYRAAFALRQIEGMKAEVAAKALAIGARLSFDSLISEWDRAGFLWEVAEGLLTRDFPRFTKSQITVRVMIAAGVVRALAHLILVFPDVKVRLRLVHLFLQVSSQVADMELMGLLDNPRCDRRVGAAIRRAFPIADARPVVGVHPSSA